MLEFEKEVEEYMNQQEWGKARGLLAEAIKKYPNEYFLYSRLSVTYHEEKAYEEAIKYSSKAYNMQPNDPLVLWDYACDLEMVNKRSEAIKMWKKILSIGIEEIAYGEFGEGLKSARSLYIDSLYRIGSCYLDLKNYKLARKFIDEHLSKRGKGVKSLYSIKLVNKRLNEIQANLLAQVLPKSNKKSIAR